MLFGVTWTWTFRPALTCIASYSHLLFDYESYKREHFILGFHQHVSSSNRKNANSKGAFVSQQTFDRKTSLLISASMIGKISLISRPQTSKDNVWALNKQKPLISPPPCQSTGQNGLGVWVVAEACLVLIEQGPKPLKTSRKGRSHQCGKAGILRSLIALNTSFSEYSTRSLETVVSFVFELH